MEEEINKDIQQLRADKIAFMQKKNAVRKEIAEHGTYQRKGMNSFSNYSYFSEAQYKELFTSLFAKHGLEMSSDVDSVEDVGTGVRAGCVFRLTDIDTGYTESSLYIGDGADKGDKGIYKAYTGTLKYWLANNWMVATGDDAEKDSPEKDGITPEQVAIIRNEPLQDVVQKALAYYHAKSVENLTAMQASNLIKRLKKGASNA